PRGAHVLAPRRAPGCPAIWCYLPSPSPLIEWSLDQAADQRDLWRAASIAAPEDTAPRSTHSVRHSTLLMQAPDHRAHLAWRVIPARLILTYALTKGQGFARVDNRTGGRP